MMTIPNSSIRMPARSLVTESTGTPGAWGGLHSTVELLSEVSVYRVASTAAPGVTGEWFALGSWVEMPGGMPHGSAPTRPTSYDAIVTLAPGTVLNVGVRGPAMPDGDEEVVGELIRGPVSKARPLDGWWGPRPT